MNVLVIILNIVKEKNKRCNINNLKVRIVNAVNSNVINKIEHIDFNENSNCLFIGTGGSYAGHILLQKL